MNVDVSIDRADLDDLGAMEQLLTAAELPVEGVREALAGFVVARDAGAVIAAAGVERYDAAVLVRSVVVAANARGRGLGTRLVDERLRTAARGGATDAYLLTTTAEAFFGRLAFATITRDAVPAAVRASAEFTSLCPASATVMHRAISGTA